jgi:hypothetical protein
MGAVRRLPALTRALLVLAATLPLIPVVIGIVMVSSSVPRAAGTTLMHPLATKPLSSPRKVAHMVGSTVALVQRPGTLDVSPGGPGLAPQPLKTQFGSPTVYLVRKRVPGWVGVVSPLAGNGRLGWLPDADVSIGTVNWTLRVSLSARQLTVLEGKRVMERYKIAIGKPSAPTPTGIYAVTDRLSTGDPSGPYGCCIIATSALAPHAIQDWDGGNRIAIHSTPPDTYWSIGEAISHGCMHVTLPEGQWLIDHIPLGTPVVVRE